VVKIALPAAGSREKYRFVLGTDRQGGKITGEDGSIGDLLEPALPAAEFARTTEALIETGKDNAKTT
jgi:hypothetical protein